MDGDALRSGRPSESSRTDAPGPPVTAGLPGPETCRGCGEVPAEGMTSRAGEDVVPDPRKSPEGARLRADPGASARCHTSPSLHLIASSPMSSPQNDWLCSFMWIRPALLNLKGVVLPQGQCMMFPLIKYW